jgi:GTPase SAR1 family protein
VGCRKRLQFEHAKGAPIAAKKADDDGTTHQKIRKIDEPAAPTSERETGRHLASLYGIRDKPISASSRIERRRAATMSGAALISNVHRHTSSCAFNDMERHRASNRTRDASLIAGDLRHPCRGDIVYPERE